MRRFAHERYETLGSSDDHAAVPTRYCIVGAGASGLIAARAFRRVGLEVEILERNPRIGGIWDIDHAGSPMYESCNFISDREHSGFIGYPMPRNLPDFPRWDQVRDYIRSFARAFGLDRYVTPNAEVLEAAPVKGAGGQHYWEVTLVGGEKRVYRGVVWACGQQQSPHRPKLPGESSFKGDIIHSRDYRYSDQFKGKSIVIVGAGNSGIDISCDAAIHGASAFLSMRRGYWIYPKRIFGQTLQAFFDGTTPMPAGFPSLGGLSRPERKLMAIEIGGDLQRLGLPAADEPLGATHPAMNDQVTHYLAHGRLTPKPAIERLDEDAVVFSDGTHERVDLIVLATGYSVEIPWLDEAVVDRQQGQPDLFLGTISSKVDGLYAAGLLHFTGPTFRVWDKLVQLAAADALCRVTGENAESLRAIKEEYTPSLKGPVELTDVHRNILHVDLEALERVFNELEAKFSIAMPSHPDSNFYADLRRF